MISEVGMREAEQPKKRSDIFFIPVSYVDIASVIIQLHCTCTPTTLEELHAQFATRLAQ